MEYTKKIEETNFDPEDIRVAITDIEQKDDHWSNVFKIYSKDDDLVRASATSIWDKKIMVVTAFSTLYKIDSPERNEFLDKFMLDIILKKFTDLSPERLYIRVPDYKKSFFLENHFSELKNGVTITKSTLKGLNKYEENN